MDRSSRFGSTLCNSCALFRLAFASAPQLNCLTLLHHVTRRPILQKVRYRTGIAPAVLYLLVNIRFQVLFHSPPGVLFTVPSQYYSLSVTRSYLGLGDGPPSFTPDFSCPVLLWILVRALKHLNYGTFTLFCVPFQVSSSISLTLCPSPNPVRISPNGLASSNFARHYFRNRLFTFFSSGYLDVSVPRVPLIRLCIHRMITLYYQCCVSTFGYLRITVYLQLPVAFRSLSRPSSAPSAKASTICSL